MYLEVLNQERRELLLLLRAFRDDFYLAGGTALALQLGHRKSQDYDLFRAEKFDERQLLARVRDAFQGHDLRIVQQAWQTLDVLVDQVKVSFFYDPYPPLGKLLELEDGNLRLASVVDIGCMKLSAITSRASYKDFVDLYFILQTVSLPELLRRCREKIPALDTNLVLKSLVYFGDVQEEKLEFMPGKETRFKTVQDYLVKHVRTI